jgi:hypothetical protein
MSKPTSIWSKFKDDAKDPALRKNPPQQFPRTTVSIQRAFETWAVDIAVMYPPNGKHPPMYRYILVAYDIFSKQLFLDSLKSRTTEEVTNSLKHMFARAGQPPEKIWTDREGALTQTYALETLKRAGVKRVYSTSGKAGAAPVESMIGHLRKMIVNRTDWSKDNQENQDWVDLLPEFEEEYNEHESGTTGMKPNDVAQGMDQGVQLTKLREQRFGKPMPSKTDSSKGDSSTPLIKKWFENKTVDPKNAPLLEMIYNKRKASGAFNGMASQTQMIAIGTYVRIPLAKLPENILGGRSTFAKGYEVKWTDGKSMFVIHASGQTPTVYSVYDKAKDRVIRTLYKQEIMVMPGKATAEEIAKGKEAWNKNDSMANVQTRDADKRQRVWVVVNGKRVQMTAENARLHREGQEVVIGRRGRPPKAQ